MKIPKTKKTTRENIQLSFPVPIEIAERLRPRAKDEDRSVSNLLRRFVIAEIERPEANENEKAEVEP
jgi:hypothetical protein